MYTTQSFIQCVADHLPGLEALDIDGLAEITDPVFAGCVLCCTLSFALCVCTRTSHVPHAVMRVSLLLAVLAFFMYFGLVCLHAHRYLSRAQVRESLVLLPHSTAKNMPPSMPG